MRELHLPASLVDRLVRYIEVAGIARDLRIWHWCRQTAWRLVKRVADEVGLSGRAASPRGLRHSYAVAAVHADVPMPMLQRWMGHSRMTTTAIYLAVTRPDERSFAERMWSQWELAADATSTRAIGAA